MKRRSRVGSEPVRARSRKIERPQRLNAQEASRSSRQTLNRIKKARLSASSDPLTETLRPFMIPKEYKEGEVVFHQGDLAKEMFLIATGKFRVTETDVELLPGRFFGELGFFAPGNRRTMSVECIEGGHLLSLTYEELLKLFLLKPEIGYYSLALSAAAMTQAAQLLREVREKNGELERSYALVRQQATQLEAQSRELVKFNQQLELRVAEQVSEIDRMARLRRFLPPQVVDLIIASGTENHLESHRQETPLLAPRSHHRRLLGRDPRITGITVRRRSQALFRQHRPISVIGDEVLLCGTTQFAYPGVYSWRSWHDDATLERFPAPRRASLRVRCLWYAFRFCGSGQKVSRQAGGRYR